MGCTSSKETSYDQTAWYLPSKDPNMAGRAKLLSKKKQEYAWFYDVPGIPPFFRDLPPSEVSAATKDHRETFYDDIAGMKMKLALNTILFKGKAIVDTPEPWNFFDEIFEGASIKIPKVKASWRDDSEFAWQRMNGINPTLIRVVDPADTARTAALFAKMPITDAHVADMMTPGYSFQRLLAEKRVFVCDYEELERIRDKCPVERRTLAPILLLYTDPGSNNLLPLAIQLGQQSNYNYPIFTPRDPPGLWLVCKMHVQVADANLHEVQAHLVATHIMMEAVYMAMNRTVAVSHPVSAWLTQHFFYTLNINYAARTKLIGTEAEPGAVPKLMSIAYGGTMALYIQSAAEFHFKRYNIPDSIARRGVGDKSTLPFYYWRDDALKVWEAVKTLSTGMVNAIYASDAEVVADTEVQAWFKEMSAPLEGQQGAGLKGVPTKVATRDELATFCTAIIYNVSAGHAAVNNGQYDYMGYVPNCPYTLRMGAPTQHTDIPEIEIVKALPTDADVRVAIAFTHMLSLDNPDRLGSYDGPFFKQPTIATIVTKFNADLGLISKAIQSRNADPKTPKGGYTYLDPQQIAQGIAV